MSIIIQNISKHARPTGLHTYELRINREVIATFKHKREDGLAVCLQKASDAVNRAKALEIARVLMELETSRG